MLSDYGIALEIMGFIIILLVSGRNPKSAFRVLEGHKESGFDKIRERIIPDRFVNMSLIIGIAAIIIGLSFQLTYFNSNLN